jgi:hypothetical protein
MKWRGVAAVVSVLAGLSAHAQDQDQADLLPRFRVNLKENLRHLPDYTCIETVARSRRSVKETHSQPLDTIRLRVGLIGGKERYTWPDAPSFDDRDLRDLVGRGIIGTGNFADHVRHVFLSPAAVFKPLGSVDFRGRQAARFDYEVPVEYSRYKLRVAPEEAEVGIHGSFLVDPETMDLLTFEVRADEIPPELGLSRMAENIGYARVTIGNSPFLLATSSDLTIVTLDGEEYRNQITFGECHQFQAESKLVIDPGEPAVVAATTPADSARASLPPATLVELALDSDIDPEKAAVGDAIRAIVTRPILDGARIIAPEGSVVRGRLVRVERSAQPFDHYVVGLEFHTLENGKTPFDFFGTMQDAGPAPGILRQTKHVDPVFTKKRTARLDILVREKPRGEGILQLDAKHAPIRHGLKMRWLTVDPATLGNR